MDILVLVCYTVTVKSKPLLKYTAGGRKEWTAQGLPPEKVLEYRGRKHPREGVNESP